MEAVVRGWGRILAGYHPILSIEITRECPLRCPGCYAYGDEHLGGEMVLRDVRDLKGDALVSGVLDLIRQHKPLHVSLVGGEPLVRYRELNAILPELARMGIYTQVVTSAVRPIPLEWRGLRRSVIAVSIDGLQPEHDARRTPATYDRILKNVQGHSITVHCTVTRQQTQRDGYIEEFVRFWSAQPAVRKIWMSLYTPQKSEVSEEKLTPLDRRRAIEELEILRHRYPKLEAPKVMLDGYAEPPRSPEECVFARTSRCVSPDLSTRISPCQFGGDPDCENCGCAASAGLAAVARHPLLGGLTAGTIFELSFRAGSFARRWRERADGHRNQAPNRLVSNNVGD